MCIFCQIIGKEAPGDIVYEDEKVVAFKNIKPRASVHLLIVPKKHIASVDELSEGDKSVFGEMFLVAKKLADENKLQGGGYQLLINGGTFAVVPHLHLHLIGGKVIDD